VASFLAGGPGSLPLATREYHFVSALALLESRGWLVLQIVPSATVEPCADLSDVFTLWRPAGGIALVVAVPCRLPWLGRALPGVPGLRVI
jgi:hypothetical protein